MKYRADVDGLRAIAVASVILFHARASWLPGGFIGVDVFFVISGFVITKSLIANNGEGFSILNFYERRCRRILPALFAMMALVAIPAYLLLIPSALEDFAQSAAAAIVGVSNVLFWQTSGYFDQSAPFVPLLHTWSLGVEEQFYIVFPLYLMLMRRYLKWSWPAIIMPVVAASLAVSVYLVAKYPMAAFYLPFGRMFELGIGCLIAVGFPRARTSAVNQIAAFAGLALLVAGFLLFTEKTPFPGLAALLPCIGAGLLIWSGGETAVGRALSLRPVVFVGLLSYSLYLWHWPILVFARIIIGREPEVPVLVGLIALTFVLGYLSWRFIERPFRHGGAVKRRATVFALSGVVISCCAFFGLVATIGSGLPDRFSPRVQQMASASSDINPLRRKCDSPSPARIRDGDLCILGADVPPTTVLFGDSFGEALMPGVEAAAKRAGQSVLVMTQFGCRPLLGTTRGKRCDDFQAAALAKINASPDIRTVILIGRWSTMVEGQRFGAIHETPSYMSDSLTKTPGYAENQAVFARGFSGIVKSFGNKNVFVVTYIPEQETIVPQTAVVRAVLGVDEPLRVARPVFENRQRNVHRIMESSEMPAFTAIDASKWICTESGCPATENGYPLYFDDNHLNRHAAIRFSGMFDQVFAQ